MKTATQTQQRIEAERMERFAELLGSDLPGERVRVIEASTVPMVNGGKAFKIVAFINSYPFMACDKYYELALRKIANDFAIAQEQKFGLPAMLMHKMYKK
jgi:hypothetical protein